MFPVLRNNVTQTPSVQAPFNRLDTLFDRVFGEDGGFVNRAESWAPVAMWEDDDHIGIEAELPGVSAGEVDITVHNGMLFIRGERKPQGDRRYLYNGRSYGRFERVITLPESVDADGVQATLTDGVLVVNLPKSPAARPKKISIKTD